MALAFLNGGSIAGRIGLGMLSDRFSPWLLASVTLFCTGFSIFVLWGVLSYTFAGIIIYGITYGFLASGWSSLWISFVKPIASKSIFSSHHVHGRDLTYHTNSNRGRPDNGDHDPWFLNALEGYW